MSAIAQRLLQIAPLVVLVGACAPAESAPEPVVLPPAASASAAPLTTTSATAPVASAPPPANPAATGLAVPARDPRPGPRSQALVASELRALEALAAKTAPSDPNAPVVQRRIAEAHVELRKLGVEPGATAIAAYEKLVTTWSAATNVEEALYYLAVESEISGDTMRARKSYFELIKRAPASPWVPYAYFAFGEMFAREGKSDPTKLALAAQAYQEAFKVPSPLAADTMWRLGQVEDAQGNAPKAQSWYARLRAGYPGSDAEKRIGEPL